jgi:GT2 family glycosyltransferase
VIVVDNGSTDDTAAVARSANLPNIELKYLHQPQRGKSRSLNAGLAHARGEIILFTDDDVQVPEDWVEQMLASLVQAPSDAVVGRIELAPDLHRPWLSAKQKWWLAAPDDNPTAAPDLIGANMGIRRSVLKQVPLFDPELGPGTLGRGEESLFGLQLVEAGFKIGVAEGATVIHHLEESRLERAQWLDMARKLGRQRAYIRYHWTHNDIAMPRLGQLWYWMKLHFRRIFQPPIPINSEGCPEWEMDYMRDMEMCKQFCIERRRQRNYSRRGLTKRSYQAEQFLSAKLPAPSANE